ncbi:hypothetical protein Tco_0539673 [Tanacetum coccineum]
MLLLAAKGLLLAVYGGRTVERDNFSHQQPPQTHRQERLTNKRWAMMSLLVGRNRGKAVCILAWQLTKVAAMADVFCFSDGFQEVVRKIVYVAAFDSFKKYEVYVKNEGFLQVRLLMLLLAAKGLLLAVYGGRTVERDNFSHQQPPQTHRQERLTNKVRETCIVANMYVNKTLWLAYTYSMPPILSLPLSMACDDSDGCVTIAMAKDEIYVECGRIIGELAAMAGLLSEYSEFPKNIGDRAAMAGIIHKNILKFLKKGKAVYILAWQLTKVAAMADVFLLRLPRSRLQKIAPHSMATSGSTERWAAASLSESHPVREIEREGCKEVESGQGKYTKQASALDLILRLDNHRSYSDSHNQRGLGLHMCCAHLLLKVHSFPTEIFNSYGSSLLILLAYAPSMPPLLSLPLSMACDDSDGCVAMVIDAYAILARQHAAVLAAMSNLLILRK